MDMRFQKIRGGKDEEKQIVVDDDAAEAVKLENETQQATLSSPSPQSASSSPSHDFSFTISLHPPPPPSSSAPGAAHSSRTNKSSFAIDLSPADDIFCHGHLLPLHHLSHLPVSPRSSTNSIDHSFTLPINDVLKEVQDHDHNRGISGRDENHRDLHHSNDDVDHHGTRTRAKSKSFSLFGLPRWRKGCEVKEKEDDEMRQKRNRIRFENLSHALKRYMKMVRPFLPFRSRGGAGNIRHHYFQRQSYSFSGNLLSSRSGDNKKGGGSGKMKRRAEYSSAPASMWTSPTNSGHLVATASGTFASSTSDSTMEELQAAIQAAIAHCKNSIATEKT